MRLREPGVHNFIAYPGREGDVYEMVTMNMTEFPRAKAILHAAETMGCCRYPLP
jgi:hypothetical protein